MLSCRLLRPGPRIVIPAPMSSIVGNAAKRALVPVTEKVMGRPQSDRCRHNHPVVGLGGSFLMFVAVIGPRGVLLLEKLLRSVNYITDGLRAARPRPATCWPMPV
jgi:hypothetical protein